MLFWHWHTEEKHLKLSERIQQLAKEPWIRALADGGKKKKKNCLTKHRLDCSQCAMETKRRWKCVAFQQDEVMGISGGAGS